MSYIIEIAEDNTICLILPDDSTFESNNLEEILYRIRQDYHQIDVSKDKSGSLGKLLDL